MFNQYNPIHGRWETPIHFKINPAHTSLPVAELVQATMDNVSMLRLFTGLDIQYAGLTDKAPQKIPDAEFVIGFLPHDLFVSIYGDYWGYANVWWSDHIYDANMVFNAKKVDSIAKFRGIQLHEWLHVLGLDHSDHPDSILFDKPYHTWQYQSLLRLPDIVALSSIYRPAGHPVNHVACVTHQHQVYIPLITHPNEGVAYSVELSSMPTAVGAPMRFRVTGLSKVDTSIANSAQHRSLAHVSGTTLKLSAFNYGFRANCAFEMRDGAGTLWDLMMVDPVS